MTTRVVVLRSSFSTTTIQRVVKHPLSRRGHNAILLHARGRPSRQFAAITPIVIKAVVVLGYMRAGAPSVHCRLILGAIVKGGKHFSKEETSRCSVGGWTGSFGMYKVHCSSTSALDYIAFVCISIRTALKSRQRLVLPVIKWSLKRKPQNKSWKCSYCFMIWFWHGKKIKRSPQYVHTGTRKHTQPYKADWELLLPHHDFYNVWHIQFSGPHSQAHTKTGGCLR